MQSITMLPGSLQEQGSIQNIFRKVSALSMAVSSLLLAPYALAQIHTDEIKVGTRLTAAGITMRGGAAPVLPLPPGHWEVVGRSDGDLGLKTNYGKEVTPTSKVDLTMVNRDMTGPVAVVVAEYLPDGKNIDWTNVLCAQGNESFVDTVGTSTSTIDYACARVRYNQTGLKAFIANSPKSENQWTKKYVSPLAPYSKSMPDTGILVFLNVNRDKERAFVMTVLARSNFAANFNESFDNAVRSWVNATGKALIAATYGRFEAIPEFPVASEP